MRRSLAWVAVAVLGVCGSVARAEAKLRPNDRVAVCGDSITEQKLYSAFIEEYLLCVQPAAAVKTMQFGWGGETSWGFYDRMKNDVLPFKPTVATTCYGMNDGGYEALSEDHAKHYRESLHNIVKALKAAGTRLIIVGSPGVVDSTKFPNAWMAAAKPGTTAAVYNKTLGQLRDVAAEVAKDEGVAFADVYTPMMAAMEKAKAKYGKDYAFAGGDGVHPGPNGHLAMAYAFLKAMGCDGDVGTITVDLSAKRATASEGHKIVATTADGVEVESTRYPLVFPADPKNNDTARAVIDLLPFDRDLNRFTLVVKNAGAEKVKVTWGGTSKEFTAGDLANGVNLAAEFPDNPFAPAVAAVEKAVKDRQNYETFFIKDFVTRIPRFRQAAPGQDEAWDKITTAAWADMDKRLDASPEPLKPVRHTIKLEAVR